MRECVYSAPRSRPGSRGGGSGARRGEDGGAAGPRAGGEGGPGVTAAEREKSASPNLLPSRLRTPPRSFSPTRLLRGSGVGSRVFLLLRKGKKKWSRRRRGEGGVRDSSRARFHLHPGGSLFPAAPARGERPGPWGRPGPRQCWVRGLPGPHPGLGRGASPACRSGCRPAARPCGGRGPGRCTLGSAVGRPSARPVSAGGRETEDCGGERFLCFGDFFVVVILVFFFLLFFFDPEGFSGSPFPSRPESGFSGWGRRTGGR